LDYSLTLHDGDGQRILGFDNAHAITEISGPGAKTRIEYDHTHKGERVRFYDYKDAVTLVTDFGRKPTRSYRKGSQSHEHAKDWNCISGHIQETHIGDCQRRVQAWEE
jgi:hypothetical protein